MANLARRVGPGLSLVEDRMMRQQAQELEAEAAEVEAQAEALDRSK